MDEVVSDTDPGKYAERDLPDYSSRNFEERGFTIGIGGCVHLVYLYLRTLLIHILILLGP